jgi:hypothetical protein
MREIEPQLYSRRDFLRTLGTGVVGFGVGIAGPEIGPHINNAVAELTGRSTGNATMRKEITDRCNKLENPDTCTIDQIYSPAEKFEIAVVSPVTEEAIFRYAPSIAYNSIEEPSEDAFDNSFINKGQFTLKMSLKEFIWGVTGSVIF